MFESLLRLTKHSFIYGVGHILIRSMGLLLFPVYTNFILPEDMGVAAILFLFLAFMSVCYQFGFGEAFLRYFTLAKDNSERNKVFSNAYIPVIISSLIFSVILFLSVDELSSLVFRTYRYKPLFMICIGILFADVLSQIPLLTLRAEERSLKLISFTLLTISVNISMNIVFVIFLKKGITGIFISNLISSLFMLLLLLPTIVGYLRFVISYDYLKDLSRFGLPYVIPGLCKIIMDLADRFILERLVDLKTVGIYNAGYKLGTFMGLVVAGFRFAWSPFFLSVADQKDAKMIYAKVMTYFIFVSGSIFLIISFFLEFILKFEIAGFPLLGTKYLDGLIIVPWIMLAYIVYGVYCNLLVGIYIEKKSYFMPMVTVMGALTNIMGNCIIIPYYGMIGAAVVTVLSYLIMVLILYIYVQHHYFVPYEFRRIVKLIIILCIIFFGGYYYRGGYSWAWRLGLLILTPVFLYLIGFFDRSEIDRFKKLIKKKRFMK